jgi:hypothetical protein
LFTDAIEGYAQTSEAERLRFRLAARRVAETTLVTSDAIKRNRTMLHVLLDSR